MRTTLSLLGVTVGIFAIIAVFTIVDSLEKSVKESFNFLGSNVIYVGKWPFGGGGGPDSWKEYIKRPNVSYSEYRFLKANMRTNQSMAIYAGANSTLKQGSNSISRIRVTGGSTDYEKIFDVDVAKGRYLSSAEIEGGRNVVIIGAEVANALFPNGTDPIGRSISIKNQKFTVIGVMAFQGQSFLGITSSDYSAIVPYFTFRKLFLTGTGRWSEIGSQIGLKGFESDLGLVELENEVRGFMRGKRQIKPEGKDNFALNRPEALANAIGQVFDVIGLAGWVIGGFSILVGGFGIANIMFVSVKERTPIIGLQKSLGAKNYFILFQFLFEAVFISLIGGVGGIFLVYLITFLPFGSLDVAMTVANITLGLGVSISIGIISGIVPAAVAARMDPVMAIRSN
ncbi:MAG TPA: ABC transporter permease [Cyclobacteriaceae bacterium]|nr:ABC transporter permease [Cyclobacteriaceae bacterium]